MKRRLSNARSVLGAMGPGTFLRYAAYHLATSPLLWERFLVKRLRGRALSELIAPLPAFRSDALVSVVLPVNNGRSKGVERLVASLKAQTHQRLELIAVDSGSSDDTVAWLTGEGFRVIEIAPADFTHAFSRNTGAAAATGQFLLFVVDDVVFTDPDWLRSALFLLEATRADAMSSRQSIDANADGYARLLARYLAQAQSNTLSVNMARTGRLARLLRPLLPLRTTIRSLAIDDTNHLVRKEKFDALQFRAPTVEDIDFATRLTAAGGRTLYTNLLSVLHYHSFTTPRLKAYARRVFIDTRVIKDWQPLQMKFRSRESLLLAALQALAAILETLRAPAGPGDDAAASSERQSHRQALKHGLAGRLELTLRGSAQDVVPLAGAASGSTAEAIEIFTDLLGGPPPSGLFFDHTLYRYYMVQTRNDLMRAHPVLAALGDGPGPAAERRAMCLFLWCNRLMTFLARPELFDSTSLRYDIDGWTIADWK